MGRWAQKSRRGGGGGLPSATILSVTWIATNTYEVLFDRPVVAIFGFHPNSSNFRVDGDPSNNAFPVAGRPDKVRLGILGATGAGVVWICSAQPVWVKNPIVFPANGIVL